MLLTLCLIKKDKPASPNASQGGHILLGLKKRGFGVNRWNGFGGKVESGETIQEAAKRETLEEAKIELSDLQEVGLIYFEFVGDSEILEVHVFKSENWQGEPQETEEMRPQWFDIDDIPYDKMWDDDRYWFPWFLEGKKFKAKFYFDKEGTKVQNYKIEEV